MKHILPALFLIFFSVNFSYAQCVIDTNNYSMFSPPADEIPCVYRGKPYEMVLQIYAPPNIATYTIDSISFSSFNGLPTGITTACSPAGCTFAGNERACINFTGTTNDTTGEYFVDYDGIVYLQGIGNPTFDYLRANYPGMLPDYYLNVIDSGTFCAATDTVPTGVKPVIQSTHLFTVYPNPNNGVFTFTVSPEQKTGGEVLVHDVTGRVVFRKKIPAVQFYETTLQLSEFPKGIYFVGYATADGVSTKKISVK